MLDKSFFTRNTNISAKVVCDSISEQGVRLTTFEIEYPRFIHSEVMTHRNLSKNSSSSRAIPITKMLEQIESNMAIPLYWGKAKSGMQATEEVDIDDVWWYEEKWKFAFDEVSYRIEQLSDNVEGKKGFMPPLHKQVPNRLSEPFQMIKVVITGTDFDNFFNLRIHKDAQPEICMLAYKMYKAMQESKPVTLKVGEWHLPYVDSCYEIDQNTQEKGGKLEYYVGELYTKGFKYISLEDAIKLSAASCASVSYRTEGMTLEKADKIFDMLIKAEVVHSSPLEHCATPVSKEVEIENSDYLTVGFINKASDPNTWEDGITHMNKQGQLCSGNLRGWVQYRHLLPNNTAWKFDYNERMELFN